MKQSQAAIASHFASLVASATFARNDVGERWKMDSMSKRGFTLVEIVLVIALLAILAVVAFPKVVNMPLMTLEMAARKVQSDIRYAQSLAASIQRNTMIEFRSDRDSYSVLIEAAPWELAVNPLTKEDFVIRFNYGEFAGVEINEARFNTGQDLVFNKWSNPGDGEVPLEDRGVIVLQDSQGNQAVIEVEEQTGRVYIK